MGHFFGWNQMCLQIASRFGRISHGVGLLNQEHDVPKHRASTF